jgi:hypothetical protein
MKIRLGYEKDIIGNNYIGVNIYHETVQPYLNLLQEVIGDDFEEYTSLQKQRDHGKYHITVINVMEYNRLCKEAGIDKMVNSLEKHFELEYEVTLMGLGTASKNSNTTYFIVVKSDELNDLRKVYGLPEYDFHITLGFRYKDVFGVRKNEVMSIKDPFIGKLKDIYFKGRESFNFIKELEGFDSDDELDVEPISINDTYATFRVGKIDYYTISDIGGVLKISAKWQDNKDKPILPNTIVYKKLK